MSRSRSRAGGRSVASLLSTKALGSVGFLAVLLFYVAWPLYAGYEINTSLETQNPARLSSKIDFPSVRVSLRPAVAAKVDAVMTDALRRAGAAGGALTDQLKAQVMPRIVDGVLATLVTPETMIRIHASGKTLKEALEGMVLERASLAEGLGGYMIVPGDESGGGSGARSRLEEIAGSFGIDVGKVLGGAGAKTAADSHEMSALPAKSSGPPPRYGFDNIKHFSLNGPLGLSIGVARDPKAKRPDLTAELGFVGGSWKVTGLVPRM